jgi:hypothetical protein
MRVSAKSILVSLVAGALSVTVQAQAPNGQPSPTANKSVVSATRVEGRYAYAEEFGKYLQHHPAFKADLERDPRLVLDKSYLDAHPKLKVYLDAHPELAAEFRRHPGIFMTRVQKVQGGHGPY